MPRKNKHDPRQLLLAFAESCDALDKATQAFSQAASDLADSMDGSPETPTMMDDEITRMRSATRRLIGILVDQTGADFHEMFDAAYLELFKETGFHAAAESGGYGTHLDAVVAAGKLPELKVTVEKMLADPDFQKKWEDRVSRRIARMKEKGAV